jgi:hypothetical protein
MARARIWLALLTVAIAPGAAFLFEQLHVSRYTFHDDGSRDLGHLDKALASGLPVGLLLSLLVLAAELAAVAFARRRGPLTAPTLMKSAAVAGFVLGGAAAACLVILDPKGPWLIHVAAALLAGVLLALVLCLAFIPVAGVPFSRRGEAADRSVAAGSADVLVLLSAAAATIVCSVWIATLVVYSATHPCGGCG